MVIWSAALLFSFFACIRGLRQSFLLPAHQSNRNSVSGFKTEDEPQRQCKTDKKRTQEQQLRNIDFYVRQEYTRHKISIGPMLDGSLRGVKKPWKMNLATYVAKRG